MKTNKIFTPFLLLAIFGCQDQLDVPNPNSPTPESARSEQGIISLAQGGLYAQNAQRLQGIVNFHELMGDAVGTAFVPVELYTPDRITLDDNSVLLSMNKNGQKQYLRDTNIPSVGNAFFDEWYLMYSLNGSMNAVLENVDIIAMKNGKRNTIKAWAFFWKGFAYSRIGSMYYAGIINDQFNKVNNKYVSKEDILIEAEKNFYRADTTLNRIAGGL